MLDALPRFDVRVVAVAVVLSIAVSFLSSFVSDVVAARVRAYLAATPDQWP